VIVLMAKKGGYAEAAPQEPAAPIVPAGGLDMPPPRTPLQEEAFPGESQLTDEERNRWLIIHVALPRTVMTRDLGEVRDTECELNDVLSTMAWGTIDSDSREFVVQSEDPTLDPPHESLISYAEYCARTYPSESSNMEGGARDENKKMAGRLRYTFTDPGQPGVKFRPMFDQMVKNLQHANKALVKAYDMKKVIMKEGDAPLDPNRSDAQNIMRFGRHQVLPSFWQLLISLVKSGRRFSLVFRTFSTDQLEAFQQEYQVFCDGKHPAYSGQNKTQKPPLMNGEKGSKNYRLTESTVGALDRMNGKLDFANRQANRPAPPAGVVPQEGAPADAGEEPEVPAEPFKPTVYELPPNKESYHEPYAGMLHQILGLEGGANAAAIVDDQKYWDSKERASDAGKLLLVDHAGSLAETKIQHIFFDGNIGRQSSSSVDVRDVVTGEPIKYNDAQDIFFHRVDFFNAVVDQEYFVRALADCERKMSHKIVQTRKMVETIISGGESPDILKTLPAKEYLQRSIIPALLPALEACQRDRPADPLEYIAFYMLRHPKQYSKTLKN